MCSYSGLPSKPILAQSRSSNDKWDISYGVYLYGWPVATAIFFFDREISPVALAALTLPLAALFGAASWFGLERWMKA